MLVMYRKRRETEKDAEINVIFKYHVFDVLVDLYVLVFHAVMISTVHSYRSSAGYVEVNSPLSELTHNR